MSPARPVTARIASASTEAISEAARRLKMGRLVAFPTETVYGLGADATNDQAVASVFDAKKRPSFNPLICHFPDRDAVDATVLLPETARQLAARFWPGSLSIIVPRPDDCKISRLASAGLDSIAVRVPAHPVAEAVLKQTGVPVAAPSANRSGRLSPTRAQDVLASLAAVDVMVLDGGTCRVGLESTVVGIDSNGAVEILREGGISREQIEVVIGGIAVRSAAGRTIRSPGQLSRHYQPDTPLRLNAVSAAPGEILLAFGPVPQDAPAGSRTLSERADVCEAAANLFAALHDLDQSGVYKIAVMPIPEEGLGRAINDRLRRGAEP